MARMGGVEFANSTLNNQSPRRQTRLIWFLSRSRAWCSGFPEIELRLQRHKSDHWMD
jgi:hypothetical protein